MREQAAGDVGARESGLARPRWRLVALSASLAVLAAGTVAAAALWQRVQATREQPLERNWAAVVIVAAGDGRTAVRDGDAARARFSDPFGIASAPDGRLYVTEGGDGQRVRLIALDGSVSTIAGGTSGFADGAGGLARFDTPSGIAAAADGTLYVADTGNNAIRRIMPDGAVTTVAGNGEAGYQDGVGSAARFNGPIGIAIDRTGRLIVADTYNDRIRAVLPDGTVLTLAGSGRIGAADGDAGMAQFDTPCGVAVDQAGEIYIADSGNHTIRKLSTTGLVTTVAPLPNDGLFRPIGIATSLTGELYVSDERGRVVEIRPGASARVVAGSSPGFADGDGASARFRALGGLAVAAPGRLFVADRRNALIRLVTARSRRGWGPPPSPLIRPAFEIDALASEPVLWPIDPMSGPFEVVGTLGEIRGSEGSERFHAGVDIHAGEGVSVRAVRPGLVADPLAASDFDTLNESMRIGPLAYVHIRVGRLLSREIVDQTRFVQSYDDTGRLVRIRAKRGARFETGDVIGSVNAFNHVHLNVGWPLEEYNPLQLRFVQFEDTVPPTIERGGIQLFDEYGQRIALRRKGRLLVRGKVHIVVDAWDHVNGSLPRRRLGLYALGYEILNQRGVPMEGSGATIEFDRLAPSDDAARLVYWSGSGIPFYSRRSTQFLYVVTNTFRHGTASAGLWDASALPPGDYTLRILAADAAGNEARSNVEVPITIAAPDQSP